MNTLNGVYYAVLGESECVFQMGFLSLSINNYDMMWCSSEVYYWNFTLIVQKIYTHESEVSMSTHAVFDAEQQVEDMIQMCPRSVPLSQSGQRLAANRGYEHWRESTPSIKWSLFCPLAVCLQMNYTVFLVTLEKCDMWGALRTPFGCLFMIFKKGVTFQDETADVFYSPEYIQMTLFWFFSEEFLQRENTHICIFCCIWSMFDSMKDWNHIP